MRERKRASKYWKLAQSKEITLMASCKVASFCVQAAQSKEGKGSRTGSSEIGRRGLFLSAVLAASQVNDSKTELLKSTFIYVLQ